MSEEFNSNPPPLPSDSAPPQQALDSAAAPLKPLLNPLQGNTPPVSTTAEPPRSPNPQNPATDSIGNNAEMNLPSASTSVVGPGEPVESMEAATRPPVENQDATPAPVPPVSETLLVDSPAPAPVSREDTAPPPLPKDASVPPTPPQPVDEPAPTLPADAIPPAVSTPTVITTENPAAPEPTPAPAAPAQTAAPAASEPASLPTPAGTPGLAESIAPGVVSESSAPVNPPNGESMDIDPPAASSSALAPESKASEGSLKRSGDDLEGREEKRIKDESDSTPVTSAPAGPSDAAAPSAPTNSVVPASQPQPIQPPAGITFPPGPLPWDSYVEPAPRPSGPTTPLTITQHKHLLSAVRSLKKNKDAVNFLEPVNVVLFNIPHYPVVITKPMDLGTIEQKLIVSDPRGPPKDKSKMKNWDESKGKYGSVSEVVQDVRQVWENTRKFNGAQHVVSLSAGKLDDLFEKTFKNMPPEPAIAAPPPPSPAPIAAAPSPAGPSTHPRRASVSQVPAIRRSSDGPDSSRPKREIHPPPSKDLNYNDGYARKPKKRNDPQLQWALRTLKHFEATQKTFDVVAPFLFPVEKIIEAIPAYADYIKNPIDLLRIKKKLEEGDYEDVTEVDQDLRLMIKNAQTFNPPNDPVFQMGTALRELWAERWKNLPPKQELRDMSEDPIADDFIEEGSDEEDAMELQKLEGQLQSIQKQIAEISARRQQRKARAPTKKSKKGGARKQSMGTKASPGLGNGNGHAQPKKPRKSKDVSYREDDGDSDEDSGQITLAQKQELAEKMGNTDPDTLNKAILIIQQSTDLGKDNEEIELDIDSLPARTVTKLYNLVVRGGRKAPKNKNAPLKKTGRKATGGANRKFMNEEEEADRIRKMEAQLQSFSGAGAPAGGYGYEDEGDSSEEESSDED